MLPLPLPLLVVFTVCANCARATNRISNFPLQLAEAEAIESSTAIILLYGMVWCDPGGMGCRAWTFFQDHCYIIYRYYVLHTTYYGSKVI